MTCTLPKGSLRTVFVYKERGLEALARVMPLLVGVLLVLGRPDAVAAQAHEEEDVPRYDLVIVGGTPGGIMAAIAAARMGRSAVILERTTHVGGLPANGLGATDIHTRGTTGGLFLEFVERVRGYYVDRYGPDSPQVDASSGGYHFEPSVAEHVLEAMLAEEAAIAVLRLRQFDALPERVVFEGRRISEIAVWNRESASLERYRGRVFIDATYEGDLAAAAGVPFRVGREGFGEYEEPLAGRVYKYWDGPVAEGSTLQADNAIQAYNYRLCLTDDPALRVPIPKPASYNREEYASLVEDVWTGQHTGDAMRQLGDALGAENERRRARGEAGHVPGQPEGMQRLVNKVVLPNRKTDANNQHLAFISTDLPEENWPWPTSSWAWRDRFAERLRAYTLGLLWFAQHDPALPAAFRKACLEWGLARDEYADNDHFPRQVYVREGRRMEGRYLFTAHDALPVTPEGRPPVHRTSITASHYAIDSHAVRKREPGRAHLDGFLSYRTRPYTVPYEVIVPVQVDNLLMPVPVSGTHLGFSTLRMEPCWMALGQAAGVAAALSIGAGRAVHEVPISRLQQSLLEQGAVLIYYEDVAPGHPHFAALQYFGLRGLIPAWRADLAAPVQEAEAAGWLLRAGVSTAVAYEPGVTRRGALLQQLYEASTFAVSADR